MRSVRNHGCGKFCNGVDPMNELESLYKRIHELEKFHPLADGAFDSTEICESCRETLRGFRYKPDRVE